MRISDCDAQKGMSSSVLIYSKFSPHSSSLQYLSSIFKRSFILLCYRRTISLPQYYSANPCSFSIKASCLAFQKVAPKQNFDAVAIAEATVAQPVATAPVVLSVPPVEAAPPAETINTAPALAAAPTGALVQATFPEFIGTDPNDPEFDLFCDP